MIRLSIILSLFLTASASATINNIASDYNTFPDYNISCTFIDAGCELLNDDFDLVEVEEEVMIPFNTLSYLPKGFNPLKGKDDLDWSKIELIDVMEEVDLLIDTKAYLPKNFNPLKGLHDINWNDFDLIEIEEELELNFNIEDYLPNNFCSYQGMA
ncbi:hypothetical protein [Hyunsoonleella aestuarii]|uniref:Uncharacterized protein n=1 Tax=Hyunsoonleella aestuarii TaxID=912802 RepID=A0ABP8EB99_9FLAO|nr:hypothetical protein [Hyunsoonleella aestuarii]